jgi:uncharacterized protein
LRAIILDRLNPIATAGSYFERAGMPATMPERTVEFLVAAPVERVWSFLSDLRQVGRCVPGVEDIRVRDETHAEWDLTVKIGPLSQTITLTTETLEQVPLRRGRFRGHAEGLDIEGTIELEPVEGGTRVAYRMAVNARGPLARILDNFIRNQLKSQTEAFATNVKQMLEA